MDNNVFVDTERAIKPNDLDKVEQRCGFSFPSEIREHYLRYNGGCPSRYVYKKEEVVFVVNEFLSIRYGDDTLDESFKQLKVDNSILPTHLVPFATDPGGDYYCFSIRKKDVGSIWFFIGEYWAKPERSTKYVAQSLSEFLTGMIDDE